MAAISPLARMAWRNVRRHWRHSVGSTLAISVGFVALGLITGFVSGMESKEISRIARRHGLGDVVVQRTGAFTAAWRDDPVAYSLGPDAQAFVDAWLDRRAGDVAARARFLHFRGVASTGRAATLVQGWGSDPEGMAALRRDWAWNTVAGRPLHLTGPESAVAALALAEALDCRPDRGGSVAGPTGAPTPEPRPFTCRRPRVQITASTDAGQVNAVQPEITGIVETGVTYLDTQFLYVPLALAQRLLDTRAVTAYHLLLRHEDRAAAIASELRRDARAAGLDLEAMPWKEHPAFGEQYQRGMQLLRVFRTLILLVVIAIAGMAVFTTMLRSVAERTREIGSLRSLGFLRRHVLALFVLEGALLAALASAIGLAATLGLTALIERARIHYTDGVATDPYTVYVDVVPGAYAGAAAMLVGVAVVAALVAARRAARMRISDALLHA
jgi:putative ABC transport system permease protein